MILLRRAKTEYESRSVARRFSQPRSLTHLPSILRQVFFGQRIFFFFSPACVRDVCAQTFSFANVVSLFPLLSLLFHLFSLSLPHSLLCSSSSGSSSGRSNSSSSRGVLLRVTCAAAAAEASAHSYSFLRLAPSSATVTRTISQIWMETLAHCLMPHSGEMEQFAGCAASVRTSPHLTITHALQEAGMQERKGKLLPSPSLEHVTACHADVLPSLFPDDVSSFLRFSRFCLLISLSQQPSSHTASHRSGGSDSQSLNLKNAAGAACKSRYRGAAMVHSGEAPIRSPVIAPPRAHPHSTRALSVGTFTRASRDPLGLHVQTHELSNRWVGRAQWARGAQDSKRGAAAAAPSPPPTACEASVRSQHQKATLLALAALCRRVFSPLTCSHLSLSLVMTAADAAAADARF